jgi:hypothetical protein
MRHAPDLPVQLQRSLVILLLVYMISVCGASASIQPTVTPRPTSAASIATFTPVQAALSTPLYIRPRRLSRRVIWRCARPIHPPKSAFTPMNFRPG